MPHFSPNFTQQEFACKGINCCGHSCQISMELVSALQTLRQAVGAPLIISSGYRCPVHNKRVGGAAQSQHLLGTAADVRIPKGYTVDSFASLAQSLNLFGGIGRYYQQNFVHLDVRKTSAKWVG